MLLLLAAASVAHAGEHYVEVWNPPEARHAPHAGSHAAAKPAAHRVAAHHAAKAKAKPSRIVASGTGSTSGTNAARRLHTAPTAAVITAPQARNLPPLLTPEGNVLRVDTHGVAPKVAR
jgi:hypothetical protein